MKVAAATRKTAPTALKLSFSISPKYMSAIVLNTPVSDNPITTKYSSRKLCKKSRTNSVARKIVVSAIFGFAVNRSKSMLPAKFVSAPANNTTQTVNLVFLEIREKSFGNTLNIRAIDAPKMTGITKIIASLIVEEMLPESLKTVSA